MVQAPFEEIFNRIRNGQMVVMVADESPESEGDLVMAAEKVTAEHVNFMAHQGRGIVSVALTETRFRELGIPLLPSTEGEQAGEQVGASVEARLRNHDALLMPTVPVIAPTIASLQASDEAYFAANGLILRNPTLINFLDGCALSLPCHAPGTAPVGLMVAGPANSDARILDVGLAIEQVLRTR